MKRARKIVDSVNIASPCHMSWDRMSGDDRVRFCESCKLHVFNISEMDVEEAANLISKTDSRLCIRLYRRGDGTVITRDCPVGVESKQRRSRLAFFGACTAAVAGAAALITGHQSQVMGTMAPRTDPNQLREVEKAATPTVDSKKPAAEPEMGELVGMRVYNGPHKSR